MLKPKDTVVTKAAKDKAVMTLLRARHPKIDPEIIEAAIMGKTAQERKDMARAVREELHDKDVSTTAIALIAGVILWIIIFAIIPLG